MTRLAILIALIATPALAGDPQFTCQVRSVHDGDTFTCEDGTHIRIWGIDAPEAYTPAGPSSTKALVQLIQSKALNCTPKGKSYNRTVALCWIGSTDIAERMVEQGQAVDWPRYSHGAYSKFSKGTR